MYYQQKSLGDQIGQVLRNMFGSGFLAIAGLMLLLSSLVSIVACILPFWFKLLLYNQIFDDDDATYNGYNITINTGLFFMDEDKFINVLMIDKTSSVQLMPAFLHWAQFLFVIATIGILVCTASAVLLMMRDKVVVSAEMALTGATTAFALCQIGGVIFCILQWLFDPTARWQDLPVKDAVPNRFGYYKILEANPTLEINWGFYFGAVSAIFCLISAVLLWLQMCVSCVRLNNERYRMLREKPDLGSSPIPGYPYYANKAYLQHPGAVLPEARPLIYTDRLPAASEVDL